MPTAHGLPGFVADQMLWNAAKLDVAAISDKTIVAMEPPLYQYHQETGLAAIPFSSQAHGLLHKLAMGRSDAIRASHNVIYPLPLISGAPWLCRPWRKNWVFPLPVLFWAIFSHNLLSQFRSSARRQLPHLQDSMAGDGVWLDEEQRDLIDAL